MDCSRRVTDRMYILGMMHRLLLRNKYLNDCVCEWLIWVRRDRQAETVEEMFAPYPKTRVS